jgi:hypothetical protein
VEALLLAMIALGLATSGCGRGALARDAGGATDAALPKVDAPNDAGRADPVDARSPMFPDGRCFTNAFPQGSSGPCACDVVSPDICGDTCVDLSSDDQNCGACGHACDSTSACAHGVCGPTPTSVVPPHAGCGEMRLAATDNTLVWTDTAGGRVMSKSIAGGTPAPISGAETTAPTLLALNGTTIFWLDGKTIRKLAGGVVSDVYTNPDDINGLVTSDDGATVYFSTGQKIQSVPAAGGAAPVDVEVHKNGHPAALAVSGSLLASSVTFDQLIDVIQLGGQAAFCSTGDTADPVSPDIACRRVACCQGELDARQILTTASKVIWADGPLLKMGDIAIDAPYVWDEITVTGSGVPVGSMAVANGVIYFNTETGWPEPPDTVVVAKAPMIAMSRNDTNGPPPIRLARGITTNVPGSLVVVGPTVYWATSACEIQSVPAGP